MRYKAILAENWRERVLADLCARHAPSRRSPTNRQHRRLSEPWEARRWLCNTLLAKRMPAWEARQEAVDEYEQTATRPGRKAALCPGFKQAQGVQERVQESVQEGVQEGVQERV
jgi:hypothetical protein